MDKKTTIFKNNFDRIIREQHLFITITKKFLKKPNTEKFLCLQRQEYLEPKFCHFKNRKQDFLREEV